MPQPKISVIVPVYNAEKTLQRCVDSILAQTFKDFELILVDDGSKDKSGVICDEYATKDPRIKVIHKPNGGVSSARNAGLDIAQGEYIAFIDSDDYVDIDYIYSFMAYNSDIIISGVKCIDSIDNKIKRINTPSKLYTYHKLQFENAVLCHHQNSYFRTPWGKIYRNSIIIINNLRFDEEMYFGEDFIFTLNFLNYANSITLFDSTMYNYSIPHQPGRYKVNAICFKHNISTIRSALSNIISTKSILNELLESNRRTNYSWFHSYVSTQSLCNKITNWSIFVFGGIWLQSPGITYYNKAKRIIEIGKLILLPRRK